MTIVHVVGHSLVRFTPGRIATMWGRYTPHTGHAVAMRRGAPENRGWHFHEPLNPRGFYCARAAKKAPLREMFAAADVVHCHDDSYPYRVEQMLGISLEGKVLVYHAHIGNIPERYFHLSRRYRWDPRVRHAAITNGYGHLFDEDERITKGKHRWGRLPDILDLDHPSYAPQPSQRPPLRKGGPLRVAFTYSNNREGDKINAKRPKGHRSLVGRIPGVDFVMMGGRPFEEAQALKRSAHVVLEECWTPYLHLSALEGAAMGALVLTSFNLYTRKELCSFVGAPLESWPFYLCTQKSARDTLIELRDNPHVVEEWGRRGREWMQKYYRPEDLLQRYLRFYGRDR